MSEKLFCIVVSDDIIQGVLEEKKKRIVGMSVKNIFSIWGIGTTNDNTKVLFYPLRGRLPNILYLILKEEFGSEKIKEMFLKENDEVLVEENYIDIDTHLIGSSEVIYEIIRNGSASAKVIVYELLEKYNSKQILKEEVSSWLNFLKVLLPPEFYEDAIKVLENRLSADEFSQKYIELIGKTLPIDELLEKLKRNIKIEVFLGDMIGISVEGRLAIVIKGKAIDDYLYSIRHPKMKPRHFLSLNSTKMILRGIRTEISRLDDPALSYIRDKLEEILLELIPRTIDEGRVEPFLSKTEKEDFEIFMEMIMSGDGIYRLPKHVSLSEVKNLEDITALYVRDALGRPLLYVNARHLYEILKAPKKFKLFLRRSKAYVKRKVEDIKRGDERTTVIFYIIDLQKLCEAGNIDVKEIIQVLERIEEVEIEMAEDKIKKEREITEEVMRYKDDGEETRIKEENVLP